MELESPRVLVMQLEMYYQLHRAQNPRRIPLSIVGATSSAEALAPRYRDALL